MIIKMRKEKLVYLLCQVGIKVYANCGKFLTDEEKAQLTIEVTQLVDKNL